jgi:hypothetical protein
LWQANANKKFCSDRCRQAAHRSQKWDGEFGLSRSAGHHPSTLSQFDGNSPLVSKPYKADLADLAYSIIGPGDVIEIEIGPSRQLSQAEVDYRYSTWEPCWPGHPSGWQPIVDRSVEAPNSDGPSIPNFLRRLP